MKKLILFELRKVFSKRLALIALIGIILFSALLSFSTFQNKYAFDPNIGEGTGKTAVEIDKEIAAKYEGILTDEKVQQMMSDFAPTSDLHGLSAIYVYQNAMQSAAFSLFSDKEGNWNGLSVSDVFGNEEIKIGYRLLGVFDNRPLVLVNIMTFLVLKMLPGLEITGVSQVAGIGQDVDDCGAAPFVGVSDFPCLPQTDAQFLMVVRRDFNVFG